MSEIRYKWEPRFWAKVLIPRNLDSCWNWTGVKTTRERPYGRLGINGRKFLAHKLMLQLVRKTVPYDKIVMHTCDNPSCVNPSHLVISTQSENCFDRERKGRGMGRKGIGVLTEADVRKIRSIYKVGQNNKENYGFLKRLSKEFKVRPVTIWNIATKRSWSWLLDT